jgi:hypothetical protein
MSTASLFYVKFNHSLLYIQSVITLKSLHLAQRIYIWVSQDSWNKYEYLYFHKNVNRLVSALEEQCVFRAAETDSYLLTWISISYYQ